MEASERVAGPPRVRSLGRRGLRLAWLIGAAWLAATSNATARDSVEQGGDLLRAALPIAALALTYQRQDAEARRPFMTSFAAMALTTWGLKAAVRKERPDGGGDDAFPSGHAAVAFHSAAFLHRRYGWRHALWGYGLATVVAWTRVESDSHDTADVLAGGAIGAAAAYWLVPRAGRLSIVPQLGPDRAGLAVSVVF